MDIRHLIDIIDFTPAEIDELIATAEDIIENPAKYQDVCAHKQLATLFLNSAQCSMLMSASVSSIRQVLKTFSILILIPLTTSII